MDLETLSRAGDRATHFEESNIPVPDGGMNPRGPCIQIRSAPSPAARFARERDGYKVLGET